MNDSQSHVPLGMVGLYGKHPSTGDFFARGIDNKLRAAIDTWITSALIDVREDLGSAWPEVFDTALPVHFWLGPGVFPDNGVAGVFTPSRDSVGRRFPLMAFSVHGYMPAPVVLGSFAWFEALEALLHQAMARGDLAPDGLLALFEQGLADTEALDLFERAPRATTQFWARNPELSPADLWHAAREQDLRKSSRNRSYLWVSAQNQRKGASILGCEGLPNGDALAWALQENPDELDA